MAELPCKAPSALMVRCSAARDLNGDANGARPSLEPRTTPMQFSERMPWARVPECAIPVVRGSRLAAQTSVNFCQRSARRAPHYESAESPAWRFNYCPSSETRLASRENLGNPTALSARRVGVSSKIPNACNQGATACRREAQARREATPSAAPPRRPRRGGRSPRRRSPR